MKFDLPRSCGVVVCAVMLALSGCATQQTARMSPKEFAPVLELPVDNPVATSGSIYNGGRNDNWFGRKHDYKVGDIITVMLDEAPNAKRNNNLSSARESANATAAALIPKLPFPGATKGLNVSGDKLSSKATGAAEQNMTITGSIAVTVTQVLANGNLVVRGEKVLDLTEGGETMRVAGIVRPEDVSPSGTVFSKRLANAQIAYTGTGDLANASRTPWGLDLLYRFWPF